MGPRSDPSKLNQEFARYDYSAITAETVRQAADEGLGEAERLIAQAVHAAGPRTFENTLVPLSDAAAAVWTADGRGALIGRIEVRTRIWSPVERGARPSSPTPWAGPRFLRSWQAGLPGRRPTQTVGARNDDQVSSADLDHGDLRPNHLGSEDQLASVG
jgi:hypothetical protein